MANNIIKRTWKQGVLVNIEDLRGVAFQAEEEGHTFQISAVDRDGNPVALSGTPAGVLLRCDNQDVILDCSIEDGKVNATLPAGAYAVPGRFGLTIFLTSEGQKVAIYAAAGTIMKTNSGTVAPPAGDDVTDLINAIAAAITELEDAIAAIPASYANVLAAMAPNYSSSALYAVGQYAWYDGVLKRCIVPITTAEAYTAAHWTNANLGNDISDLKSALISSMISHTIIGMNLFDGQVTSGEVKSNGIDTSATSCSVSKLIFLMPGTYAYALRYNTYVANAAYYAICDQSGNVKEIKTATSTGVTVTVGSITLTWYSFSVTEPAYIIYNAGSGSDQVAVSMLVKIDTTSDLPSAYVAYNKPYKINENVELTDDIYNQLDDYDVTTLNIGKNIYNGTPFETDGYFTGASFVESSGYKTTNPIKLFPGTYVYNLRYGSYGGNSLNYVSCDESGNISRYLNSADTGETITIGTTTYNWYSLTITETGYFRFNMGADAGQASDFMLVPITSTSDIPSTYQSPANILSFKNGIDPNAEMIALVDNPLRGKKISLNGDSICAGVGYAGGYGKIIAEKFNMSYQNIAVGGGTVAGDTYADDQQQTPRHWISRTISNMVSDADYAIVEGGVNDAALQVPLGSITNDFYSTNVYDDTTFYGAMESMFKQLTVRFAGKKIGYIIPHQCSGRFCPGETYYNAAIACCTKWGIPVLDLSVLCPPFGFFRENTDLYTLKQTYTKDGDGWHPNEQGYKKYYVDKIIEWLESL